MAQVVEPGSGPPLKPLIDAAALAAPAVLVMAGCLYYAGYTEKYRLYRHFGLPEAAIAESFQQTLARGFAGSFIIICCILAGFYFFSRFGVPAYERFRRQVGDWNKPIAFILSIILYPASRSGVVVLGALYFGMAGAIAGGMRADIRIKNINAALANGCATDCFVYVTNGYSVVGVAVDQDDHRIIVATVAGARVVQADALQFVRRYYPSIDAHRLVAGDRYRRQENTLINTSKGSPANQ